MKLLKLLTFLPHDAIEALEAEGRAKPEARTPQRALARELTTLVHGQTALDAALRASEILFGGSLEGITEDLFNDVAGEAPTIEIPRAEIGGPIGDLFVRANLSASKSEARRDLTSGGLYLNNVRCADPARTVSADDLLFGRYLLLRKGKRSYAVISAQ